MQEQATTLLEAAHGDIEEAAAMLFSNGTDTTLEAPRDDPGRKLSLGPRRRVAKARLKQVFRKEPALASSSVAQSLALAARLQAEEDSFDATYMGRLRQFEGDEV